MFANSQALDSRLSTLDSRLSRRDWLRFAGAGLAGCSMSGWLGALADEAAKDAKKKNKSCILLWMNGGPSQIDTFDLKTGHANGGPVKGIDTAVEGIKITENLPKLAKHMKDMAIIRSMSSKEADHGQGSIYVHTGYEPRGPIQYPTLGSLVAKEIGSDESPLPNFVSLAPYRIFGPRAYSAGFLGPKYAPMIVGEDRNGFQAQGQGPVNYEKRLKVDDLAPAAEIIKERFKARVDLLKDMEKDFVASRPGVAPRSHQTAYERAVKLMETAAVKAFDLEQEKAEVRDRYGRNLFGQSCLLARRLVEQGVPFIEVTLGGFEGNNLGWDTHSNNFDAVKRLCQVLDPAWASLMTDLKERSMLDSTLIVWAGEFGRTPKINGGAGRDHFPDAWSTVLAGGGIKTGQTYGKTSVDGMKVEEKSVSVPDFVATVCKALDINTGKQNMSNIGRPIRVADPKATAIADLLPAVEE